MWFINTAMYVANISKAANLLTQWDLHGLVSLYPPPPALEPSELASFELYVLLNAARSLQHLDQTPSKTAKQQQTKYQAFKEMGH